MSFATPRPDMTNRLPKRMVLGEMGKKTGRPPNGLPERIRTIAWFKAVATGLGKERPGTIGRLMQEESDARGLNENHDTSKRWNKYAKGDETPSKRALELANDVIPGTAEYFLSGPAGLWVALWEDFQPQFFEDDISELLATDQAEIDMAWLARVVLAWRKRAAIGWPNNIHAADGLYEAIHTALKSKNIELHLSQLGVLDLIKENIKTAEKNSIQREPDKHQEIESIGRLFSNDPIDLYLSNPIGFWLESMKINSSPGQ